MLSAIVMLHGGKDMGKKIRGMRTMALRGWTHLFKSITDTGPVYTKYTDTNQTKLHSHVV